MVFSSHIFLWVFLPVTLALYFIAPRRVRNFWILLSSLFFYAWGESWYTGVMLGTILFNWGAGLIVDRIKPENQRKGFLAFAVAMNLGLLVVFKYSYFLSQQLASLGLPELLEEPMHLPIGVSFFVFQAISYVVDVYRRQVEPSRSLVDYAAYKALFPQLIAGPIVRYKDVASQIKDRRESLELFASGVERFIQGLSKKVLIANVAAQVADTVFNAPPGALTAGMAWWGALAYALQIYFDFSGYSDMAIGLGRMMGFTFLENFRLPYGAVSIQDFWRRWHISLSSWFRDYLYIPLGGSRQGQWATVRNLVIVFALCGLWHGASWNFLLWGLWHGLFLGLERLFLGDALTKAHHGVGRFYMGVVVLIGWVLFRAEDLPAALLYLKSMMGMGAGTAVIAQAWTHEVFAAMGVGLLLATGVLQAGWSLMQRHFRVPELVQSYASLVLFGVLLLLSFVWLTGSNHNPFIYFRF